MSTTVSRTRSTPRTSLVLLLGLLFAITTLFSSPTNAVCDDDPDSGRRLRRKSCDWLKSKRKGKITKLCKKMKNLRRKCPSTCGLCNNETRTCPTNEPDVDSPCDKAQVGLRCPYAYNYLGCTFAGGFHCSPAGEYTCNNNSLIWEYSAIIPLPCVRPDDDIDPNVQGTTCEPCPQVEPEDMCSTEKPTPFEECSIDGITCSYDFVVTGCSVENIKCLALSSFSCYDGKWGAEAVAGLMPCEPLTIFV